MAKLGLQGLNNNAFAYFESTGSKSLAVGMVDTTGNYVVVPSLSTGATPAGTYVMQIENAANGNVNITPNGSGRFITTNETVTTGLTLGYATQGVLQTDAVGVVTSSTGTDGQILINNTATGVASWANITAGANITITNAANAITIDANAGAITYNYTGITDADSPYTATATDDVIGVDCSAAIVTVLLPDAPATGRSFIIKDFTGSANTFNITLSTPGGVVLIDAAATYVMNTNYQSVQVIFNGTKYMIV
jgi:hypothetical protein